MTSADPGLPTWVYFEPVGDVSPEPAHVFVVNVLYLLDTKGADLPSGNEATSWPVSAKFSSWCVSSHVPIRLLG